MYKYSMLWSKHNIHYTLSHGPIGTSTVDNNYGKRGLVVLLKVYLLQWHNGSCIKSTYMYVATLYSILYLGTEEYCSMGLLQNGQSSFDRERLLPAKELFRGWGSSDGCSNAWDTSNTC